MSFRRPQAAILTERLLEPRRHIQVVTGPRQVGKSTLVQHVVEAAGLALRGGISAEGNAGCGLTLPRPSKQNSRPVAT